MIRMGWMTAAAVGALMGAMTLSGCQKKSETQTPAEAAGQAQTQAQATTAAPEAAAPAARPLRKPGLWRMTMTSQGMHQESQLCVDKAVDEKLGLSGQRPGANPCHENKMTPRPGGGFDIESVCDLGEAGTMTSKGTVTGDFNADYKVDMTTTTKGAAAPQMNGTRSMTMEARWMGPCPAGMQPGDMTVAGMKMNLMRGGMGPGMGPKPGS